MKTQPDSSPHLGVSPELALVRNANFSRLWGAQILSQIGQNMLNFALIIRVFQLAQGTRLANVSVALVVLAFGVPSIFFAAIAGVYVDHWNRKKVLIVTNAVRAVLVLGYLLFENQLILVLLLTLAIASATQFFVPAEAASIPVLVGRRNLLRANSLFVFTLYASFIVGYSASAPVIHGFGPTAPYWLTAVMFGISTLLVAWLPDIRADNPDNLDFGQVVRSTKVQLVKSFRSIQADRRLSFPILQLTLTQASVGVILALAPAFSLAVLKTPLQSSSYFLIIPAGLGMVAGVALVGYVGRFLGRIQVIHIGLIVAASSLLLLGLVGQLYRPFYGHTIFTELQIKVLVAVLVLVLGVMNALVSVTAQTLLHEGSSDQTRGKVFGVLNMSVNIAATVPIFLAGILADLTSVTKVFAVMGFILLTFVILQAYRVRPASFEEVVEN